MKKTALIHLTTLASLAMLTYYQSPAIAGVLPGLPTPQVTAQTAAVSAPACPDASGVRGVQFSNAELSDDGSYFTYTNSLSTFNTKLSWITLALPIKATGKTDALNTAQNYLKTISKPYFADAMIEEDEGASYWICAYPITQNKDTMIYTASLSKDSNSKNAGMSNRTAITNQSAAETAKIVAPFQHRSCNIMHSANNKVNVVMCR